MSEPGSQFEMNKSESHHEPPNKMMSGQQQQQQQQRMKPPGGPNAGDPRSQQTKPGGCGGDHHRIGRGYSAANNQSRTNLITVPIQDTNTVMMEHPGPPPPTYHHYSQPPPPPPTQYNPYGVPVPVQASAYYGGPQVNIHYKLSFKVFFFTLGNYAATQGCFIIECQ